MVSSSRWASTNGQFEIDELARAGIDHESRLDGARAGVHRRANDGQVLL